MVIVGMKSCLLSQECSVSTLHSQGRGLLAVDSFSHLDACQFLAMQRITQFRHCILYASYIHQTVVSRLAGR